MRKFIITASLLCFSLLFTAGCYGPFRLTRKVYDWNGSFNHRWEREAMFLVLNILPVYGFSALADAVFFNLIEFWGGDNPIAARPFPSRYIARGDQQAVVTQARTGNGIRIDLFDRYRPRRTIIIGPGDGGMSVARDADGTVLMKAMTLDDGHVLLADEKGTGTSRRPLQ